MKLGKLPLLMICFAASLALSRLAAFPQGTSPSSNGVFTDATDATLRGARITALNIPYGQSSRIIELRENWKLAPAKKISDSGEAISQPSYEASEWYAIRRMPATVLDVLQQDGEYRNLYYGKNLLTAVPQDLWKQDWWYRTNFLVPAGKHIVYIDFPGINYRAEIWLNGHVIANSREVAGMYVDHKFDVSQYVLPGKPNALAVKVTPERLIKDVDGVELADSWTNWINAKYLGYKGPVNVEYLPKSKLTATYSVPGDSGATDSERQKISLTVEPTGTALTLTAVVTSNGVPLTSGVVRFNRAEAVLGNAPVDSNGVAKLRIETSDTLSLYNRSHYSFIADRNAGIWKPVSVYITNSVKISNALVDTDLPLPATNLAKLSIFANLVNNSSNAVKGLLEGDITRTGKQSIHITQSVSLSPGETKEIKFDSSEYSQLIVHNPDLWWPYTLGKPALYDLHLVFVEDHQVSDKESIRFGIRKVTQYRDDNEQFPELGKGGNFYLKINGKNFLIRGAAYTPDLLYHYDPEREAAEIRYAKDMGLNLLRWESKISSEHILELADEAGVPVMYGWMCCTQWESWEQWNAEDRRVAADSLRSQILMLRSHAAAFIWADGSDGRPPKEIRDEYHRILTNLHWQNAVVDTVSSFAKDESGNVQWDGIHMAGPYSWRPPSYWFSGRYGPARGSCAEQGDTEIVPPYESLKKFIPSDKLWPIGDFWFTHAGGSPGVNELASTQLAVNKRYGTSKTAEEFARKAQLGAYENSRAQFENYAASGWADHKMSIYWMLNMSWPSFYGGLYDYYLKPGGAYYGAKKGLRPVSVVFDYYAPGDHSTATIRVVNQTANDQHELRVRTRIYDLLGRIKYDQRADNIQVPAQGVTTALTMPLIEHITSTYFIRCELFTKSGVKLVDNVYWQSTTLDDLGSPSNETSHDLSQASWADLTALNTMPKVQLQISGVVTHTYAGHASVNIMLHNPSDHIAFFERVEVTKEKDGNEILPIRYDDNYVTVFPGETIHVTGTFNWTSDNKAQPWLKLEGYNTAKEVIPTH